MHDCINVCSDAAVMVACDGIHAVSGGAIYVVVWCGVRLLNPLGVSPAQADQRQHRASGGAGAFGGGGCRHNL